MGGGGPKGREGGREGRERETDRGVSPA